jgi:excisionase family DNA binding protein
MSDVRPAARHGQPSRCLVETVQHRARRLGVSELTVRRHIKGKRVRAIQIGGTWRIPGENAALVYDLPPWCSVRQVANSFDVSELTVRRWIASGALAARKSGRVWKIDRHELIGLIDPDRSQRGAGGTDASRMSPPQRSA